MFQKRYSKFGLFIKIFWTAEVADFWESVVHINTWHQNRISRLIVKKLFGSLSNKKIAILGFAFKANTNDTRESASIKICRDLLEEGAELIIHDPIVNEFQISIDLGIDEKNKNNQKFEGYWRKTNKISEVFKKTHAIVILTEWSDYSKIDWLNSSKYMKKPAWVFDARSVVNREKILEAGLNFWRIGDGT